MAEITFPKIQHKRDKIWELFSVGRLQADPAVRFTWEWQEDDQCWAVTMETAPAD